MSTLKSSCIAATIAFALALTSCGGGSDSRPTPVQTVTVTPTITESASPSPSDSASADTSDQKLMFKVIGYCTRMEGTLTARGSGFTPNGAYATEAWYPSGMRYTNIDNPGHASDSGATPEWKWPCSYQGVHDPAGRYRVKIVDLETGRSIETYFVIHKP